MKSADPPTRPDPDIRELAFAVGERQEVLAPLLAQLGFGDDPKETVDEIPSEFCVGEHIVELDSWERSSLRKFPEGEDAKGRPWPALLAEGIAFKTKCLEQAGRMEENGATSPEQRAGSIDALITDAAIGIALVEEIQLSIDGLVRDAETGVAKRLTELRKAIFQDVTAIRDSIGREASAKAERKAEAMMLPGLQQGVPAFYEEDSERPDRGRATGRMIYRATVEQHKSKVIPLLIALAFSAIAWIAIDEKRPRYTPPPELTLDQFSYLPSVQSVQARPPSLYVTLDRSRWQEMPTRDRRAVLNEISRIAGHFGYVGVHVRTSDGATVGRWSGDKGVTLLRPTKGGT
jgi:hypothetical protein